MDASDVGARPTAAPLTEMNLTELRAEAERLGSRAKFTSREAGVEAVRTARRRANRAKPGGPGTIRETAERLLRETAKPYSQVLEDLKETFPRADTSRSSLRWYATQMRLRGEHLPERPIDHPNQRAA
jgi:hypothetical protein